MRHNRISLDGVIYAPCVNGWSVHSLELDNNRKTVKIPETVRGSKVVRIRNSAFYNNKHITEVYLPATIESIEDRAFYSCENLQRIVVSGQNPKGMRLGRAAFYNCKNLKSFKQSVELDGAYVFQNCFQLESISTIGDIPVGAFWGDYNLKLVHIFPFASDNNVHVENGAFTGCSNLKTIYCYAQEIKMYEKELSTFASTDIYCEADSNLWDLFYQGYKIKETKW